MKKLTARWPALPAILCFVLSSTVSADSGTPQDAPKTTLSKVEITWQSPNDYRDIRPSNETRKGFRERVFSSLGKHFNKLAEALPEGQSLSVTVTNIDLAGQVWPTFGAGAADIRIVDRVDIPRMAFSYELKENGDTIKSAEVKLKEMAFMNRISRMRSSEPFGYEKAMLTRWFDNEFEDNLAKR